MKSATSVVLPEQCVPEIAIRTPDEFNMDILRCFGCPSLLAPTTIILERRSSLRRTAIIRAKNDDRPCEERPSSLRGTRSSLPGTTIILAGNEIILARNDDHPCEER